LRSQQVVFFGDASAKQTKVYSALTWQASHLRPRFHPQFCPQLCSWNGVYPQSSTYLRYITQPNNTTLTFNMKNHCNISTTHI